MTPEEESSELFTIGHKEVTMITKKRNFITYPFSFIHLHSLGFLYLCTFDSYKKCSKAVKPVNERFAFESRFTQQKDTMVAFEMLTDDVEDVKKKVIYKICSLCDS